MTSAVLSLLAVFTLCTAPAFTQAGAETGAPSHSGAATADYSEAIAEARAVILQRMEAAGLPGVSVSVAVRDQVVWTEGFGFADLENRTPVTPDSRFRIGSVSKPLTAFGLALLVQEQKLDLDAPVQQYVPAFPAKEKGVVTTRLLAGHLAGVRHYRGMEFLSDDYYATVGDALRIFAEDPLLHEPGTKYWYSSYGWNLVSAAMEGASGRDFLAFMEVEVFEPLEMSDTVPDRNLAIVPHRVRFYDKLPGNRLVNSPYVDNSYKWAGGGFLSTTRDLVRFGSAHLAPGLLEPETLEQLWTSQKTTEQEETGYGIGWFVGSDAAGRRTVQHGGGSIGGTTQLILYPESGVVVAMAVNLTRSPPYGVRLVAEAFLP